jgi:hypothetical protein
MDELGLKAKVTFVPDGASLKNVAKQVGDAISKTPAVFKAGPIQDFGKFVNDLGRTMRGDISGGLMSSGGLSNIFGKGAEGLVGKLAGLSIIGQNIADVAKGMLDRLSEASPILRAQLNMWNHAINNILRPMGDSLAHMLAPLIKGMMAFSRVADKITRSVEQQYGAGAGLAVGVGMAIGSVLTMTEGVTMQILGWQLTLWGNLATSIWNGFNSAFGGLPQRLVDTIVNGVKDGMTGVGTTIENAILDALGIPRSHGAGPGDFTPSPNMTQIGGGNSTGFPVGQGDSFFNWGGWHAAGGISTYYRPTLIGVGEAGPETVDVRPSGRSGGGSVVNLTINGNIYGVSDLQRAVQQIMDAQAVRMRYR